MLQYFLEGLEAITITEKRKEKLIAINGTITATNWNILEETIASQIVENHVLYTAKD